jgi:hypothetical protein
MSSQREMRGARVALVFLSYRSWEKCFRLLTVVRQQLAVQFKSTANCFSSCSGTISSSDNFAEIDPASVPAFMLAELVGALVASPVFGSLLRGHTARPVLKAECDDETEKCVEEVKISALAPQFVSRIDDLGTGCLARTSPSWRSRRTWRRAYTPPRKPKGYPRLRRERGNAS